MADETAVPAEAQLGAKWPTFPDPDPANPTAVKDFLDRTKETLELMTGQRGPGEQYSTDERFVKLAKVVQDGDKTLSASITTLDEVTANRDLVLAQRTTVLEAEVTDARGDETSLKAKLTQIQVAQVEGDTALAEDIETVEAVANGASAEGRVYIRAEAGPAGASASYGWYITAGEVEVGMHALVKDDGTGAIGFDASNFYLADPAFGIAKVFEYADQAFTFNIPVTFNGDVIINGTVQGAKMGDGSISNMSAAQAGLTVQTTINVRRLSSRVLILGFYNGGWPAYGFLDTGPGYMVIERQLENGTWKELLRAALNSDTTGTGASGSSSPATMVPGPSCFMHYDSPGLKGMTTYRVRAQPNIQAGLCRILVMELSV